MKKFIFILFTCLNLCFAESWNYCDLTKEDYYSQIEYFALSDTDALESNTLKTDSKLKAGTILKNVNYYSGNGYDEKSDFIRTTLFYAFEKNNYYYSEDNFCIAGSDCFPEEILTKNSLQNNNMTLIPEFFKDILDDNSFPDKLYYFVPELKNVRSEDGDYWYEIKNLSFPPHISFRNTRMTIYAVNSIDFIFTKVKKIDNQNFYIEFLTDFHDSNYEQTSKIVFINKFNPSKNNFRLNINNNIVTIYQNDEKIVSLISVDSQWINDYQENLINNDKKKYIELKERLIGEIPSNNVSINKLMTANCNLKLRAAESTSSNVLSVMAQGTKVKILELGKAETIDGISSNWVKVEVQGGAKDRDGKPIAKGLAGWAYGGYLE